MSYLLIASKTIFYIDIFIYTYRVYQIELTKKKKKKKLIKRKKKIVKIIYLKNNLKRKIRLALLISL